MAKGNSIDNKLRRLRRRFPKRQKSTGYIYAGNLPPTNKVLKRIRTVALFVSNEGGTLLREHVFGKSDGTGKTRKEWKAWLDQHYGKILNDNILATYAERFGGFWRIHTMIGWTANVNKRSGNTVASKTRNKPKRARK